MLCIECGKREAKYDGLCEECFISKVKFTTLPQHLDIVMCPHCHAIKFGGKWERVPINEAIKRIVDKNLKFLYEHDSYSLACNYDSTEGEFEVEVDVNVKYRDLNVTEHHVVRFELRYESCPRCNRYYGNYFEAILQLRGLRKEEQFEVLEYAHNRVAYHSRKNEDLFLTKEVEKKEGWDLYLSDKKEAKKIARELCHKYGASLKESPQIAGRKDGQDIYRITYAVRLPEYRIGDIIEVDGRYYVVSEIHDKFVSALDLYEGKRKNIDSRKHHINRIAKNKDLKRATVVYCRDGNIQLLSENNEIIETTTQINVANGATVKTLKINGNVYIIP